jgi:hypothetical protein
MDDTKSNSFAETLIPPTHVVCGVELRPFSLGHWTFLDQYSSPLLSPELYPDEISSDPDENYKHSIRHILLLIMVCGHSYEDNQKLIDDKEFFDITRAVLEENIANYIHKTNHWNIFIEVNKVKEYLNYYINSMPNFVERGSPSPPSGIDWMQNLYAVMKNEYGYSQSEIMNMSMRRIYSEWTTFAAKNGAITVKTKQQIQSEKEASEYAAKVRSEIKEKAK